MATVRCASFWAKHARCEPRCRLCSEPPLKKSPEGNPYEESCRLQHSCQTQRSDSKKSKGATPTIRGQGPKSSMQNATSNDPLLPGVFLVNSGCKEDRAVCGWILDKRPPMAAAGVIVSPLTRQYRPTVRARKLCCARSTIIDFREGSPISPNPPIMNTHTNHLTSGAIT